MTKKRHKYRLRKQVIICIPVLLFIIILSTFLIINRQEVFTPKASGTAKAVEPKASIEVDDVVSLSDRDFFVNLSNMTEERQKDNTVIYYAQKFKLNVDKTLEIARRLTKNYQDEKFIATNYIPASSKKAKAQTFNSFEAGIIFFIRDIYRYPERYGTTYEEIRASEDINTNRIMSDGYIYLDGLTFQQYLGRICDLFGIEKSLALAISYHESGILKSNLFVNSNNIGGQKGYEGWMKFPTLEAGTISFVLSLKNIIETYEVDLNSELKIFNLSGPYVYGTKTKTDEHWASKVSYYKEKIEEQDLFTIK